MAKILLGYELAGSYLYIIIEIMVHYTGIYYFSIYNFLNVTLTLNI